MKRCAMCKKIKKEEEFNKDKNSKDGRYSYCSECRKPLLKKWAETYKEKHKKQSREWEKKNKDKKVAHGAVRWALLRGKIEKAKECSICGREKDVEAHHPDYKKKLFIIWVCPMCHKGIHSGRIKQKTWKHHQQLKN